MARRKKSPNDVKQAIQYRRDNYDVIQIIAPKGAREVIRAEASKRGMSVTQLFLLGFDKLTGLDFSRRG